MFIVVSFFFLHGHSYFFYCGNREYLAFGLISDATTFMKNVDRRKHIFTTERIYTHTVTLKQLQFGNYCFK